MANRAGPNDWLSAEPTSDDGHVAYILNVNVLSAPSGGDNVTIVGPLGTQAIAAAVAVTPATSSSWAITAAQLPAALAANGGLKIEGVAGGVAVPVSAASLPLPSGAATEATLAAASAKLPASLGAKTGATSFSVVPASDGFAVTVSGTTTVTGTVAATQSGTWNITNISGTISLPTGAATAAKQPALGTAGTPSADVITVQGATSMTPLSVNIISGQTGVAAGAGAVSATVQRMTLASDDPAVASLSVLDDWDESDRAKVNLIVGQAGITAGAGAVAANTPRVTHASDDPAVASLVTIAGTLPMTNAQFLANLRSTAAFTSVNSGASSVTILASNANRKGAIIVNTDANALYLDLTGGTATTTTRYATSLATGDEYEVPFGLTGTITGIWAADGSGAALVTEFS